MTDTVQIIVLDRNIYLDQPGEKQAVKFYKGESVEIEREHAEAILAGDEEAERDFRIAIVGEPIRRAAPKPAADTVAPPPRRGRPPKVRDED